MVAAESEVKTPTDLLFEELEKKWISQFDLLTPQIGVVVRAFTAEGDMEPATFRNCLRALIKAAPKAHALLEIAERRESLLASLESRVTA